MTSGGSPFAGYSRRHRPLAAYGTLVGLFNLLFAAFLLVVRGSGRTLPQRIAPSDLALVGVATYKLSRLIAKDSVTSVVRAPFTEYEGAAGASEVNERPRGRGMQKALGELLTCPFCVGQWVAAALAYGLVLAPRTTRLVAALFSVVALADFLQFGYAAVRKQAADSQHGDQDSARS
ncbi:MAG TPA: DUF1360 domain-containing protein [Chloroflexota bacterium]|nr:DUF1360 domain-containing protein [Chloroflexota bacterium]